MTQSSPSAYRWEHEYRATIDGASYGWPIRSQLALALGHRFFLPLTEEARMAPDFARPIWKPRLSPNFAHVEVVSVEEKRLVLHRIPRPAQLPHTGERPT